MIKIGQEEICEVLRKKKEPLSRSQIAELLNDNPNKVSKYIKILLFHNEIKCIEISRIEAKIRFGDKAPCRRFKLYYIS